MDQTQSANAVAVAVAVHGAPGNDSGFWRNGYIARSWRGDLSLGWSYWINGAVLGNLLPLMIVAVIESQSAQLENHDRLAAATGLVAILFSMVVPLWAIVGIWRSADRHVGRGGSTTWATLAKAAVVLSLLGSVSRLTQENLARQVGELAKVAVGYDEMPIVEVKIAPNGRSALLSGLMGRGSAEKVAQLLDSAPGVRVLELNSGGGRVNEAKRMAGYVQRRKLDTYVDGLCASACTMVFLAGADRGATPNAKIGFHRTSFAGEDITDSGSTNEMATAFRRAGISEPFLKRALDTPSDSMWYPERNELVDNHVVTRTSLGGETASDLGSEVHSASDLQALFVKRPLYRAIEARFPGTTAKAANAAWAVKAAGGSDGAMASAGREVMMELSPDLMKTAVDNLLEDFLTLMLTEINASAAVSSQACIQLLNGKLDLRSTLPADISKMDAAFTMKLVESEKRVGPMLSKEQAAVAMQPLLNKLQPEQVSMISTPKDFLGRPGPVCDSFRAYYSAVKALPPKARLLALRAMFQSET